VHPQRILTKGGARAGDVLLLTKPLGSGIVTTAAKKQKCDDEDLEAAVASMSRLSNRAGRLFREAWPSVHALTDITGYALIGHGHEMADQSGLTLRFAIADLPVLPGARDFAERGMVTGGAARNGEYYGPFLADRRGMTKWERQLILDPQTSGGLLGAVAAEAADDLVAAFHRAGEPVWRVGEAVAGRAGGIEIV
jgi:selenide,water dikinase